MSSGELPTLASLAAELAAGRTSSQQLVAACLERIEDAAGEGSRTFLTVDAEAARREARRIDALREAGAAPSRYAGIPVSVKDAFDRRGQVTRAGSTFLDRGPAARDAAAVWRWRRAGLVVLGSTNMTEFAFSGLGINPHYGTPANPWDRERGRIPGGSSAGAAVSVSDGMAFAALGSDTGGSCRIPAAFCGLVGFKPTQSRVSREGMVPLAESLDTVGPIAPTVACCAALFELLDEGPPEPPGPGPEPPGPGPEPPGPAPRPPRLAVPGNYFSDQAEPAVTAAFDRALGRLEDAGAELVAVTFPELEEIAAVSSGGGLAAAESFAWHRELIAAHEPEYDPRVLARIRRGERQSPGDVAALREWRRRFVAALRARLAGCDGFVCPTVPILPPALDAVGDDDEYARLNLLVLRNPTVVNLLDGCAISVPMNDDGEPPSGLMLAALGGEDATLLRTAAWAEERLRAGKSR